MSQILDGKILAQNIKDSLWLEINGLKKNHGGKSPRIVSLLVSDDPAAAAYAGSQKRSADQVGIAYDLKVFPATTSMATLMSEIRMLNDDQLVHGIMLLKPLPPQLNYQDLANTISLEKDIEGVNVGNIGNLVMGHFKIIPCTAAAAMEHIKSTGVSLSGKEAVVVGRSEIVGKPVSLLLLKENATVTVCHSGTSKAGKLQEHISRADILVAAVGQPGFVKGEWIKPGAIVIDVGINKVGDKITGDVEFEEASKRASYITPVPGGVGPVTAVMLMKNAVEAYKLQNRL